MQFFTNDCCDRLLGFVGNPELRSNHFKEEFDNSYFQYLRETANFDIPSDIVIEPIAENDLENSILIFEALKLVERVQANDRRLWVMLTHTRFFEYTRKRWSVSEEDSDKKIISRFHFEGNSLETRMRNSISRLWWAAKLTYDEEREDPYELTRLLWSRQDIFQNLLERSYGTYDSVVKGFLEFYSENVYLLEGQLRRLFTALNAIGGVKLLSIQTKADIKQLLRTIKQFYKFDIAG